MSSVVGTVFGEGGGEPFCKAISMLWYSRPTQQYRPTYHSVNNGPLKLAFGCGGGDGGGGGGSRSYRVALTPPAHPKQYRGCHLTLRPSFVTILHDSFRGGSRGQNTTMACPYSVSSRDEQERGLVKNCCNCDSVDGLVLQGKILCVGLWTVRGRWVISGLCREVPENWALLGYYAASSGNYIPTFRGNLLVLSKRVSLKVRPTGCRGQELPLLAV